MRDKCQDNRDKVVAMAEQMKTSERVREFYRRQGECRERERIIERIRAQICFDALADQEGRCANHSGKCFELGLLVKELQEAN